MSIREIAIKDIREDLRKEGKSFLAFHRELNPVMNELVKNQIKAQELCNINSSKETK